MGTLVFVRARLVLLVDLVLDDVVVTASGSVIELLLLAFSLLYKLLEII